MTVKKYLVTWKKDSFTHNGVWEGSSKKDVREQLSWKNIKGKMIVSIEELKEDNKT